MHDLIENFKFINVKAKLFMFRHRRRIDFWFFLICGMICGHHLTKYILEVLSTQ